MNKICSSSQSESPRLAENVLFNGVNVNTEAFPFVHTGS